MSSSVFSWLIELRLAQHRRSQSKNGKATFSNDHDCTAAPRFRRRPASDKETVAVCRHLASGDASLVELEGCEELEPASMDARTPLQPAVVTPKQALSIKPFGLDMDVLLTTEATGGATSVIVAWHKPGEGPPDHVHFKSRVSMR
jgi:hypothetical protein